MQEQRGYEIAYERLYKKYVSHVDRIQTNTSFYIKALESALIDSKFKYNS